MTNSWIPSLPFLWLGLPSHLEVQPPSSRGQNDSGLLLSFLCALMTTPLSFGHVINWTATLLLEPVPPWLLRLAHLAWLPLLWWHTLTFLQDLVTGLMLTLSNKSDSKHTFHTPGSLCSLLSDILSSLQPQTRDPFPQNFLPTEPTHPL